jgi:hypothetical protein
MDIFLQTRGRTTDYGFIGTPPSERWWMKFKDVTSFEKPTLLVTADGSSWRVYLSGIPSVRQDRVNTSIRYTIVVVGQPHDEISKGGTLKLISSWITDSVNSSEAGRLQRALDESFDEAVVERLIQDKNSPTTQDAVKHRMTQVLSRLENFTVSEAYHDYPCLGAVQSPIARNAFMQMTKKILSGDNGAALFVNLIGTLEEAQALAGQYGEVCVLIDDIDNMLSEGILPLQKKKQSEAYGARKPAGKCPEEEGNHAPVVYSHGSDGNSDSINHDVNAIKTQDDSDLFRVALPSGVSTLMSLRFNVTGRWVSTKTSEENDISVDIQGDWKLISIFESLSNVTGLVRLKCNGKAIPISGVMKVLWSPKLKIEFEVTGTDPENEAFSMRSHEQVTFTKIIIQKPLTMKLMQGSNCFGNAKIDFDIFKFIETVPKPKLGNLFQNK